MKELHRSIYCVLSRRSPSSRSTTCFVARPASLSWAFPIKPPRLSEVLELACIAHLIDCATSSDDAGASKPAPDIVEAALEQAAVPSECVVMLGDTPYDVKAAQRAGVRMIGLRCGGWTDRELRGATETYANPAELLARYDSSVLAG